VQFQGALSLLFRRPLTPSNSNYQIVQSNPTPIIWAKGATPSDKNNIPYHNTDRSGGTIVISSGSVTSSGIPVSAWKVVHAFCMATAFLVCFPLGIISARWLKWYQPPLWFRLHQIFQYTGICLTVVGIIIALAVFYSNQQPIHRALGLVAGSLVVFQFINAPFRPPPPKEGEMISHGRQIWNFVHHWTGRSGAVIGIVNVFFGLHSFQVSNSWYVLVAGFIALFLLVALFLAFENFNAQRTAKYETLNRESISQSTYIEPRTSISSSEQRRLLRANKDPNPPGDDEA